MAWVSVGKLNPKDTFSKKKTRDDSKLLKHSTVKLRDEKRRPDHEKHRQTCTRPWLNDEWRLDAKDEHWNPFKSIKNLFVKGYRSTSQFDRFPFLGRQNFQGDFNFQKRRNGRKVLRQLSFDCDINCLEPFQLN